jgi:formylglycine-generating enzyme required for sulfatase activity
LKTDPPMTPDLELLVEERASTDGKVFDLRLSACNPKLGLNHLPVGSINLRTEPAIFFRHFLGEIWKGKPQTPASWRAFMEAIQAKAAFLSERILPKDLRQLLTSLQGKARSLLVQSDEPWIPWEILCLPEDPQSEVADGPFLCEAFAMTRWLRGLPQTLTFPLRRIAMVAPRDSELAQAEGEWEDLQELARGETRQVGRLPARLENLLENFRRSEYDGWHFTTHGFHRETVPDLDGLWLEEQEELNPSHLSGKARRLGDLHPLIFLNACSSGRNGISLTSIGGWAPAFLKAQAGACIGTLWPVDDRPARDFARAFYAAFTAGTPMAEAVFEARQKIRSEGNPTWLAYTAFAHPRAVCEARPSHVETARKPRRTNKRKEIFTRLVSPRQEQHEAAAVIEVILPGPEPAVPPKPTPGEERIHDKDGTVLVYVPGGRFNLDGGTGGLPEKLDRRVCLSPFWMGKHPVTNEQYGLFLAENPGRLRPAFWEDPRFNQPRQPVVGVSWEEAQAYCRWAGLELPTEVQWEAAARGSDRRIYPWGNERPTPRNANFSGISGRPAPVGSFPAGTGPFGTLDQAGNVWEWCADPWSIQAYQQFEDGELDPVAKGDLSIRCVRGGSWMNPPQDLLAACRERRTATLRVNYQGFRCIRRMP